MSNDIKLETEENKRLAHEMFTRAWNDGDMDIIGQVIAPDAVDHAPVSAGSDVGPDAFRAIVRMFRDPMPDLHLTIEDEIAAGDRVVHRWWMEGTQTGELLGVSPTGKRLRLTGITIVRFKDRLIRERWAEIDQLGLLQQLGVVPTGS